VFADWAGDTREVGDALRGEAAKGYVFVAVLPFSGLVFARAYLDMKMGAWLDGHIRAFEAFGGVPALVVPDNAATATHRAVKGDAARFVSDRYQQLADHYGCAIVPAGVRKPRHKAAVESAVNVVYKRVLGYLAQDVWTSIDALNDAIDERVAEINADLKRKDGTTRRQRFDAEEGEHLRPLPQVRFEEVEWKVAKVARNYHVTCETHHYSVPWRLGGQLLRVRIAAATVTILDGTVVVATHPRKSGRKGQYATDPAHVPPAHQDLHGLWSRSWFVDKARRIGPATQAVIEQVLDRKVIEAQGYLDCQNILEHLAKKGRDRLEAACQQALNIGAVPTYSTLKRLMAAIASDAGKPTRPTPAASTRKPPTDPGEPAGVHLRGADYYARQGW
jgi:transposase